MGLGDPTVIPATTLPHSAITSVGATDHHSHTDANAKMETGSYTGDGAESQVISLTDASIVVKFVKTWQRITGDNNNPADKGFLETTDTIVDDHGSGIAIQHAAAAHVSDSDAIIALGTGSFTVDDKAADNHPNKLNQVYNYMVIGT